MKHNPRSMNGRRVPRSKVAAAGIAVGVLLATLGGVAVSGAALNHAASGTVVSTLKTTSYGTILVSGKTVYTLKASKTACTAKCLKTWPQLLLAKGTTKATAGPGVSAAKLGTLKVAGGRLQVTFAGQALYWFYLDRAAGQVKGNTTDTWGKWSVVVTVKPSGGSPTTTTTAPGGGGVGF
jgi:predicted lipoprotein with Yx(FWY)xxD motif